MPFPKAALLLDARGTVLAANTAAVGLLASVRVGDPVSFAVRVPEVLEALRASVAAVRPAASNLPSACRSTAGCAPISCRSGRPAARRRAHRGGAAQLRRSHAAARVEQMRVDFVANASHELRTPLASLSGFIETLQGPARNDANARERFLKIMNEQARRMSRLIDDLLSLSRIELNAHLRRRRRWISRPWSAMCARRSPRSAANAAWTSCSPAAEQAVEVRGDRDELIRVFENLVENALKYGGTGGRVEITLAREGTDAVATVRDYGPGIAPEHVPRLTERFYRVDTAIRASRAAPGSALPSSSTSSPAIAARWASRARRASARHSPCVLFDGVGTEAISSIFSVILNCHQGFIEGHRTLVPGR